MTNVQFASLITRDVILMTISQFFLWFMLWMLVIIRTSGNSRDRD